MWNRIPPIFKNKYFLTLVAFGVWITFFDRNNLVHRRELNQTMKLHQQEKEYYLNEIKTDSLAIHHLVSDTNNLIRFGREKYHFLKEDEDLFLVTYKED